jgi:hypothetical protein
MDDRMTGYWFVGILVAAALIGMILLVRGTSDHSRYDDAPVSSWIESVA